MRKLIKQYLCNKNLIVYIFNILIIICKIQNKLKVKSIAAKLGYTENSLPIKN